MKHECKPDITVVVPVYNSVTIIHELVRRIEAAVSVVVEAYEVILIDDYSSDGTWDAIKEICMLKKRVKGYRLVENKGQWYATLAGMYYSKGEYIVTIDDDLEYDPNDIVQLYDHIRSNRYDVVFGIAANKYHKQSKVKWFAEIRNMLLNLFWKKGVTDSFKILKRSVVFRDSQFLPNQYFEAFIQRHLDVKFWGYLPVNFNKRHSGQSNHTVLKKIYLFLLFTKHHYTASTRMYDFVVSDQTSISSIERADP